MKSLTTNQQQSLNENAKISYFCQENLLKKISMLKIKQNCKDRDYCHYTDGYRGAVHRIYNLQHSVPKEILIVFHNGSIYDYHFIIKEPAQEYENQSNCLGENTAKYLIFSVPMEKEVIKFDRKGKEIPKTTCYRLQFINSTIFMSSSLSNLVNNLAERIHKVKTTFV